MFTVHEFQWDDNSVERFWNYYATQNKIAYFAQQVGKEVLGIAKKHVPFKGNILDYGCGKGDLIGLMLANRMSNIYGADFSGDSVKHVETVYGGAKGFKQAYLLGQEKGDSLKGEFFDCVFLLETIEHLISPYLDNTLSELFRIVKPGGHVIITTPSNEDLETQKVLCPNCGAHYHRVQHVNSFSENSISSLMKQYGFEKTYCKSIHLEGYFTFRKGLARVAKNILRIKTGGVNLIYIGQKRQTSFNS